MRAKGRDDAASNATQLGGTRTALHGRMGTVRIRNVLALVTTLPASVVITACLFLPHTRSCNRQIETPFDAGTWLVIAPLVLLGLLPLAWQLSARVRRAAPDLVLSFTMIVLGLFVVTIPIAIYLMWGYAKRTFRGELLVALCSATCVMLWLFFYPLITMFDVWLPAAEWTWGAAVGELVGMIAWTAAAAQRPWHERDDERVPIIFRA